MAICRNEIFKQVQEVLVDALGVDDGEVTTEATLMGDLGAESIDFLDIVFRLEKAFNMKIPREELFPAEDLMNNSEFIHNGKLTERGLAELRVRMPHTDLSEFEKNPDINKLGNLFTVDALINYVDTKLYSEQPCAEIRDGNYVECRVCGQQAKVKIFDPEKVALLGPDAIRSFQQENIALKCQDCGYIICFSCSSSNIGPVSIPTCPSCKKEGGPYFFTAKT